MKFILFLIFILSVAALNDTIKLNQGRVEDWSNKKLPINNTDDDLDQALSDPSTIWPNGRVPYILDSLFSKHYFCCAKTHSINVYHHFFLNNLFITKTL